MKILAIVALLATAARAVTITATFDSLAGNASLSSGYTENGITFTSPTNLQVVTTAFAGTLFGWGGSYTGNALTVKDDGWVGISTGSLMDSVSLKYGFDWDGYAIEYGLMDVNVEWNALLNGQSVGTGGLHFDRDHRSHGGDFLTADTAQPFDQLLIRSTAVGYRAIPWVGPNPGGWYYDRGAVIGYGSANHIAFDDVSVTTIGNSQRQFFAQAESVPDGGTTSALLGATVAALLAFHSGITRSRSLGQTASRRSALPFAR